jgi:hypothetical protein
MSNRCPVVRIDRVEQHPTADHLNVNYFYDTELGELQTVSDKKEGGVSRYAPGSLAAFFPHQTILPADFVQLIGYVKEDGSPGLDGKDGCKVRASNFKGVRSMGILVPCGVKPDMTGMNCDGWLPTGDHPEMGITDTSVNVGDDVYPIITSPLRDAW